MIIGNKNINFFDFYKSNIQSFQKDQRELSALLEARDVKYGPWTLSFEMAPAILDNSEADLIKSAVEKTVKAAEILTDVIVESPEKWRDFFPWNNDFFNLALVHPGYSFNVPCSRFDIFYNSGDLKFVELNTDGCSGMTNADLFHKSYMEVISKRRELNLSKYKPIFVVPYLLNTLLNCYKEFIANFPESKLPKIPTIAILDLAGEETHWEFSAVKNYLSKMGFDAIIVNPEQADFQNGKLSFDGKNVHLIYRRLLGTDYAENMKLLSPITNAFLERKVCMVGAPRSQFPFSKKFFAFLQEDDIQEKFDDDVRYAVNKFIPWTRIFRESETFFKSKKVNLVDFVRKNKNFFVLKPCESKCGYGISQGKFVSQKVWNTAINSALENDYIVQEFIDLPTEYFPRFLPESESELRHIHLGGYSFGGKFSGILGRTCANPLLTVIHGERLLPVLF